jgi:hypothetical protein
VVSSEKSRDLRGDASHPRQRRSARVSPSQGQGHVCPPAVVACSCPSGAPASIRSPFAGARGPHEFGTSRHQRSPFPRLGAVECPRSGPKPLGGSGACRVCCLDRMTGWSGSALTIQHFAAGSYRGERLLAEIRCHIVRRDPGCSSGIGGGLAAAMAVEGQAADDPCSDDRQGLDLWARGCRTSIAHPTLSRSPSQPGHPVLALMRRPCESWHARSALMGSTGTAVGGGTSGSGRPSGRRNWSAPSGKRATW